MRRTIIYCSAEALPDVHVRLIKLLQSVSGKTEAADAEPHQHWQNMALYYQMCFKFKKLNSYAFLWMDMCSVLRCLPWCFTNVYMFPALLFRIQHCTLPCLFISASICLPTGCTSDRIFACYRLKHACKELHSAPLTNMM